MQFRIILKSFTNRDINYSSVELFFIGLLLLLLKIFSVSGIISLPTLIKRFCILTSPHIDKDAREQFEIRISKKFLDVYMYSNRIEYKKFFFNLLLNLEILTGISCFVKTYSIA